MTDLSAISQHILERCHALGFAAAGICNAAPTDFEQELRDWLGAGKHGEMDYLQRNLDLRIDPRVMVNESKSIIVVADRYSAAGTASDQNAGGNLEAAGKIARYARGEDYHVVMRKRLMKLCDELATLFPDETFRPCVDTAPVLEREHAQRAGIGAVAKNTLILQRSVGSYLLLGEIITTLSLGISTPAESDPCGTCTCCIDACPTGAITPWSVDASKCISYLTIEHRGEIDEQYHQAMGDWIFGCDICQEVCPHNQPTVRSRKRQGDTLPAYVPRREALGLMEILNWDETARQQAFIKSSMKRAKLNMMKRNALIAAGNVILCGRDFTIADRMLERIKVIAYDPSEDEMVRNTARVTLRRIVEPSAREKAQANRQK